MMFWVMNFAIIARFAKFLGDFLNSQTISLTEFVTNLYIKSILRTFSDLGGGKFRLFISKIYLKFRLGG